MEGLFFIILFFFTLSVLRSIFETKVVTIARKIGTCPPHTWRYKIQPETEDEYLVCEVCKILPGSNLKEEV